MQCLAIENTTSCEIQGVYETWSSQPPFLEEVDGFWSARDPPTGGFGGAIGWESSLEGSTESGTDEGTAERMLVDGWKNWVGIRRSEGLGRWTKNVSGMSATICLRGIHGNSTDGWVIFGRCFGFRSATLSNFELGGCLGLREVTVDVDRGFHVVRTGLAETLSVRQYPVRTLLAGENNEERMNVIRIDRISHGLLLWRYKTSTGYRIWYRMNSQVRCAEAPEQILVGDRGWWFQAGDDDILLPIPLVNQIAVYCLDDVRYLDVSGRCLFACLDDGCPGTRILVNNINCGIDGCSLKPGGEVGHNLFKSCKSRTEWL